MYILRSKHTWFAENPMIWGSPIIFRKNMDFTGENADPCYQIGKFSRAKWGCFSNADFGVARQVFGHDEGGPMEAGQ